MTSKARRLSATGECIVRWIRTELIRRYARDFSFRGVPIPLKPGDPRQLSWHFGNGLSYAAADYLSAIEQVNRVIDEAQVRFDLKADPD